MPTKTKQAQVNHVPNPQLGTLDEQWDHLITLHHTDTGNAEAFVYLNGHRVRYNHRKKKWLVWNGTLWAVDETDEARRLALETLQMRQAACIRIPDSSDRKKAFKFCVESESAYRIQSLLKIASSLLPVSDNGGGWDEDDWLLGCANGVIELKTGCLRPGKQEDRITISTGIEYDHQSQCPRWMKFLSEVFVEPDLIDFVWRAVGYSLTGMTCEEVLFLCYGTGANGKSKFTNRLRDILGGYSWNTQFSTFEALERHGANNDVAAFAGMRAVTASETREGNYMDEARVKSLTGGEDVTARYLYSEPFVFRPKMKIWLGMNHKPKVADDSYGFWRRVRLIPFTQTFKGRNQDKDLEKKLKAEAAGILKWAIEGCLEWQKRGLEPPQSVVDATNQYQQESDSFIEFLNQYCVIGPKTQCHVKDMYQAYSDYCDDIGEKALSGNAFGRRMSGRGFDRRRDYQSKGGPMTYFGIGLKTPAVPPFP